MLHTFRGGIHMDDHKHTAAEQIKKMPAPNKVIISLWQHIGAQCTPVVKVGDAVDKGQIIGVVEQGLGCPVHASVSGKVIDIKDVLTPAGRKVTKMTIENDGEDRMSLSVVPLGKELHELTPEECIEAIRLAGISGMGGATFPTHAKILSALGKVDNIIINCAECEPFITADHRLVLEYPDEILDGLRVIMHIFGLKNGIIAIEDNKMDAVEILRDALKQDDSIDVKVLKTKYPQGDERQLIYALTGKELPVGKLPADVGCVVFNAETCYSIGCAVFKGMPLIERVITVAGDCVSAPKNVLAPIGTPMIDLINFCGGLSREPSKLISGGPMMGVAQWDMNSPVSKGTNAILAFSEEFANRPGKTYSCIHCGRCLRACPMRLMPLYMADFAQIRDHESCEKLNIMSCVECGSCSYVCPGRVPLVQFFRTTKAKINEEKRAKQLALAATRVKN